MKENDSDNSSPFSAHKIQMMVFEESYYEDLVLADYKTLFMCDNCAELKEVQEYVRHYEGKIKEATTEELKIENFSLHTRCAFCESPIIRTNAERLLKKYMSDHLKQSSKPKLSDVSEQYDDTKNYSDKFDPNYKTYCDDSGATMISGKELAKLRKSTDIPSTKYQIKDILEQVQRKLSNNSKEETVRTILYFRKSHKNAQTKTAFICDRCLKDKKIMGSILKNKSYLGEQKLSDKETQDLYNIAFDMGVSVRCHYCRFVTAAVVYLNVPE